MQKKGMVLLMGLLLLAAFGWGSPFSQDTTSAIAGPDAQDRLIQVTGDAEISIEPDLALIVLAVETRGNSADAASKENAQLTERVIAALKSLGLDEGQIETGNYRLFSDRQPVDARMEKAEFITSYRSTNELNISTDELALVGNLIDTAINAGANQVRSVQFEVKDSEVAKLEALQHATRQAQKKAEAIAEAAGVTIKGIRTITEQGGSYSPYRAEYMMEMADRASNTPIMPGDVQVQARVIVEYNF